LDPGKVTTPNFIVKFLVQSYYFMGKDVRL